MKKIYLKLFAVILTLVFSLAVVATASYAWFVLSKSPVANGIQVSIGGGNTILIAPDLTETDSQGITYHYPGVFAEKLNFAYYENYYYLAQLGGLSPVSTADGINWFVSTYVDAKGELQKATLDSFLEYANLTAEDEDKIAKGSYVYLDFWVVSPGSDYKLRVSTNDEDGGSFVIDLLEPTQTEDGTGYTLSGSVSSTAASVRVGFLASPARVTDDTMLYYQRAYSFEEEYTQLRGVYQEPGYEYSMTGEPNYFTIYEPNGDAHPTGAAEDGAYLVTDPIGLVSGQAAFVSVMDRVTVQLTNRWRDADSGGTIMEQIFQTSLYGMDLEEATVADVAKNFYLNYLQGQVAAYVDTGDFVENTSDLTGGLTAQQMAGVTTAGATDDVYIIELERNVPQRIRMYIWLEAMDADWDDQTAANSFAMNIELAGGTE